MITAIESMGSNVRKKEVAMVIYVHEDCIAQMSTLQDRRALGPSGWVL